MPATLDACSILNTRLNAVRETMSNPTWAELVAQCYNLGIDLSVKVLADFYFGRMHVANDLAGMGGAE